ncbi:MULTISPECIES: carbohydrate ABC transporter permease [Streptomyces]|uniref:Sugar ABC transporter permease n=1 Tax=Streptomyces lycii TaxID=2654337 RepID=A0ABQ7FN16_9ACTN|nr:MULTISPECIES: sugar ABC transporter permease [Streptomyces]KAF4409378.1 sugar ABC transporter permease [Streptomyces lycii]PGH50126.1 ABC transporter permease [Streptomyces sp. Ru87]
MKTVTAGAAAAPGAPPPVAKKGVLGTRPWVAACFLLPALVLLGALVLYPIGYSVFRSFFGADGSSFVGLDNYGELFSNEGIRTAIRNNVIWVVLAPTVSTALGLIYAVMTERIRWGTAFKLIIFMPMAISMLASGIIFRLVYEQDPDRGVANAVWVGVHDTFAESSAYPGARPRPDSGMARTAGGSFTTESAVRAGDPANLPLVGIPPAEMPKEAAGAEQARPEGGKITGTVWLDFVPGGKGEPGRIDSGEKALSGITVEAVRDGEVVAKATVGDDGTYSLPAAADGAQLRLPGSNFAEQYNGVDWLGPSFVTPAIIGSYIWMWAGFAMVLIAAGLAGVPRELLEAARVDGATEWQVFRKVTVPLLAPVLAVVLVTLMINVLKIFDLVYIIAPGATLDDANVLALQLYLSSFGADSDQGVGSAIAVLLLLLVLPVMLVNIRRIRRERRR